jgi:GntR family transcriptional regulator
MALLRIDPRDAVPIWKQIEEGLRRLVGVGGLRPGQPVPSVRDLARELGVNPMTVSKSYQRLADAGVLAVRRGEGTFVADAPPTLKRYVAVALTTGVSREEAAREVGAAWDGARRREGGR